MVLEWWLKPCLLTHAPQKKWGTPLGPPSFRIFTYPPRAGYDPKEPAAALRACAQLRAHPALEDGACSPPLPAPAPASGAQGSRWDGSKGSR